MKQILIIAIIILSSCLAVAITEVKATKAKYSDAIETIKAYDAQLDSTRLSNRAYKMTVD